MDRSVLENLLAEVEGCTFASIDTETEPSSGILKVTKGQRIILFTNKKSSGYDNMVKRRLMEAGKNPDNFVLGELPWGMRVPNSPLIEHKGKTYLQCIHLTDGESKYALKSTGVEVDPELLGLRQRRTNQGLAAGDEVIVSCYNLDNIERITLMGETLVAEKPSRSILRLNFKKEERMKK